MSANPFWDFSLELYERPGVADACIALQDAAGLDVNLLLYCIWCAAVGPGRLAAGEMRTAVSATSAWQEGVVKPLRAARRVAKSAGGASFFASAFQRDVAATELSSERVEQWMLFDQAPERAHATRAGLDGLEAACG